MLRPYTPACSSPSRLARRLTRRPAREPRQVCAAGALLNLLGPLLEPDPATGVVRPQTTEQRAAFGRVIMLALVTGMAFHGIYSPDPDD